MESTIIIFAILGPTPSRHKTLNQCWVNVGPFLFLIPFVMSSYTSSLTFDIYITVYNRTPHIPGLGPKYSVLRYFGTRVPILQYLSVLSTRTFKKYLYSYLYSSTFNEYLRVLYEY